MSKSKKIKIDIENVRVYPHINESLKDLILTIQGMGYNFSDITRGCEAHENAASQLMQGRSTPTTKTSIELIGSIQKLIKTEDRALERRLIFIKSEKKRLVEILNMSYELLSEIEKQKKDRKAD